MREIELLESELKLMLDNIERLKKFKGQFKKGDWKPYNSAIVGELKHRGVALKQRLTIVSKIVTHELLR